MPRSSTLPHLQKWKTDPSNGTKAILGEDDSKTKELLLYGKIYLIRTRVV